VIQKMQKNIGIIYRIRQTVSSSVLVMLYQTLVHPYIEYCNIVWAICPGTSLNRLFACQKRAIRTITYSKVRAHTTPLFHRLNILSVHDVNKLQVASFMYGAMHDLLPKYFCNMFMLNSVIHRYFTRQCNKVHITSHRLNIRRFSVQIYGPKLWNSLPPTLLHASNIFVFKRLYRRHLLE